MNPVRTRDERLIGAGRVLEVLVAAVKEHEVVQVDEKVLPVAVEVLGDRHAFTTRLREICGIADANASCAAESPDEGRES